MPLLTTLLMAACVGVGQGPDAEAPAEAVPSILLEIRDIIMASPDWRGRMVARLEPIARDGGGAVWALDDRAVADLFNNFNRHGDVSSLVTAPHIRVGLGEPARMSNESAHKYVAHLTRTPNEPPNEGTQLAFEPEFGEIRQGVRVDLLPTRFEGSTLFARVVVEENRLRGFHTVQYSESPEAAPGADPNVAKASFLGRLRPDPAADKTTLGAVFQVPEVDSRRVDSDCMFPADGALLISLGPNHRRAEKSKPVYAERLILITVPHVAPSATTPEGADVPVQAPEAP